MGESRGYARYRLGERLGQGGMGTVYKAVDEDADAGNDGAHDVEVALKVGNVPTDDASLQRLVREMRHASSVIHPNICAVLDSGKTPDGSFYLAMELCRGPSFTRLAKTRRAAPSLWLEALRALAQGLAAVHAQGIIHRDVKPQNVMFDEHGTLKLLDFGIARSTADETVTETGQILGTTAYMSPEQARAESLDGRSDLFSAALTAATLASGGVTRFSATSLDLTQKIMHAAFWQPPLLSEFDHAAPPEVEDLFSRVLTLRPADRLQSAQALVDAIDQCSWRNFDGERLFARWVRGDVDDGAVLESDCQKEMTRARALTSTTSRTARVLALRRASLLVPDPAVLEALKAEAAKAHLRFDDDFDAPRVELLEAVATRPPDANELRRGIELFERSGHIEVATRLMWIYVRERPDDAVIVQKLERTLFGDQAKAANTGISIARGIRTGGLAAQQKQQHQQKQHQQRLDGLQTSASPASTPTKTLSAPAKSPSSALPPVVIASSSAPPASSSWLLRGLLAALLASATVFLLVRTLRDGKESKRVEVAHVDDNATVMTVDERSRLVDQAEAALAAKDAVTAIDATTRALGLSPSMETGQRALFLRAQAYMLQQSKGAARRDLELYLARVTNFDDRRVADAKRLLASLDDAPALVPGRE